MQKFYRFHQDVYTKETSKGKSPVLPNGTNKFIKVLTKCFQSKIDLFLYERDKGYNNTSKYDKIIRDHETVEIYLGPKSTFWHIVLGLIKNVGFIEIVMRNSFKHYNWVDNVESISLDGPCNPKMFDSGKMEQTPYETWMDVSKNPDAIYIIDKPTEIDKRIKRLLVRNIDKRVLDQLKEFRNLEHLTLEVGLYNPDITESLREVECPSLCLDFAFGGQLLDEMLQLDMFSEIRSNATCSKEILKNTTRLIDGYFNIKESVNDNLKYLDKIFTRNRRCLNTKSANKKN